MIKAIVAIPIVLLAGTVVGVCIGWAVNAKLEPLLVVPPYMAIFFVGLFLGGFMCSEALR